MLESREKCKYRVSGLPTRATSVTITVGKAEQVSVDDVGRKEDMTELT